MVTVSQPRSDFAIETQDRTYLRELARKMAEYAGLPIMEERRQAWRAHNALRGKKPMLVMEENSFAPDFLPPLRLRGEAARLEDQLLRAILNHEVTGDDKVVPGGIEIPWEIHRREFDLDLKRTHAADQTGREVGYAEEHPIQDLARDFHLLKPSVHSVNRERTFQRVRFAEEILGDLLPVRIINDSLRWFVTPSRMVNSLMGTEGFMLAMIDNPDEMHALYRFLQEDMTRFLDWQEQEGLLVLNNGNDYAGAGSFGFTDELPKSEAALSGRPKKGDLWFNMNSQETVSISAAMYEEFIHPCYAAMAEQCGLVYFGCCEPVHPIWDRCVSKLHGLRKVSVSAWCDEAFMGERLRGSRVIYSRKPNPTLLGVGAFDPERFRAHIAHTLEAAKGCQTEIIFRDIYSLCGEKDRAGRAIRIARELIEEMWE